MMVADDKVLRIGAWRVDPALDEISRDGATVKLEPRAMRVLLCLADHAGQVVSVDQLLDAVWKDVVVTPDSVYQAVAGLRRALGDTSKEPAYIANVLRRGYRLVAAVTPWNEAATASSHSRARTFEDTASTRLQPIEDRPSLAVLPLVNMSSNPEQEYFADGITDGLITELSRLPGLFVISRHSSFVYKGISKRAAEIGAELGIRYLLEGSVQRAAMRVRITVQLIDAASGAYLWAERYDRELKDIFAVQDDVTQRVVSVLQVKFAAADQGRSGHGGTVNVEAHDCLLHGLERLWLFTPESTREASVQLARAVALDPGYAAGHTWLARVLVFRWIMLWDPNPDTLEGAYDHIRLAVDLDPKGPLTQAVLCWVQLWRKQGEAAIAAGWRAVDLDPNNADAYLFLAYALAAASRGEEALHNIVKGMRLNPHPTAVYHTALCLCYIALEDYDLAIAACKRGIEVTDIFYPNHYMLCLIYTLLGRDDEARVEREKLMQLTGGRKPIIQLIWLDEDLRVRMDGLTQLAGIQ